jgi:hypothetical protein
MIKATLASMLAFAGCVSAPPKVEKSMTSEAEIGACLPLMRPLVPNPIDVVAMPDGSVFAYDSKGSVAALTELTNAQLTEEKKKELGLRFVSKCKEENDIYYIYTTVPK